MAGGGQIRHVKCTSKQKQVNVPCSNNRQHLKRDSFTVIGRLIRTWVDTLQGRFRAVYNWLCARRLAKIGLAVLAGFGFLVSSSSAWAKKFETKAKYAILLEASTGTVLYAKAADVQFPPASMSKLMTLALVFKALKAGKLSLTDAFKVSEHAWRTGGAPSRTAAMMVPVNTSATLEELIQGIIVQSGNDATIAVAEGMAGSEETFAQLMEQEGKRIGLKNSGFANPTGLPHPKQKMTAHDLARLARHIIYTYPEFYKLFAQKEFNYRRHKFYNRNRLLFMKIGVDGLKTGYTKKSGFGIVTSAVSDGRRLIAVVAGLDSRQERWREASRILEWGFKGFRSFKLFDDGEIVGQARVWGGESLYVPLAGRGKVAVLLPRYPVNQKLSAELVYMNPLKPPIRQGDQVAKLRVTSSTGVRNEVPLYAVKDVKGGPVWWKGTDAIWYLTLGWLPTP